MAKATKVTPIQQELKDLQERIQGSQQYQTRASKKMLLVLLRIVWKLANRVDALERRNSG